MAHPKSASFRTADVVGLDTFGHVADNCYNSLTGDEDRAVFAVPMRLSRAGSSRARSGAAPTRSWYVRDSTIRAGSSE